MKFIKPYEEFKINDDRIQWVKIFNQNSSTDNERIKELANTSEHELYDIFIVNKKVYHNQTEHKDLDIYRPVFRYAHSDTGFSSEFINKHLDIVKQHTYNYDPELAKISGSKKIWHKTLGDKSYLPKTVYSRRDTKDLNFPIIAKPESGHSGIGIEKFESYQDLINSKGTFDVYSEMIDFAAEYRALCLKDNAFIIYERVPNQEDNSTIKTKDKKEKVSFIYIEQDLNKLKFLNEFNTIIKDTRKHFAPDFYALDFFIDKNGKVFLIESNLSPGLGACSQASTYKAMYKDFYKKDPPEKKLNIANNIINEYREIIKKEFPKEYKLSKNPI